MYIQYVLLPCYRFEIERLKTAVNVTPTLTTDDRVSSSIKFIFNDFPSKLVVKAERKVGKSARSQGPRSLRDFRVPRCRFNHTKKRLE